MVPDNGDRPVQQGDPMDTSPDVITGTSGVVSEPSSE